MFWSKSSFFKQHKDILAIKKEQVKQLLKFKEIDDKSFLQAYEYFVFNANEFDGATLVKDLNDIKDLDLSAMEHDYNYIIELPKYKGKQWLKTKIKYDWNYGKSMERLGKGIWTPYFRSIGLIVSTPFYYIILKIQKKINSHYN